MDGPSRVNLLLLIFFELEKWKPCSRKKLGESKELFPLLFFPFYEYDQTSPMCGLHLPLPISSLPTCDWILRTWLLVLTLQGCNSLWAAQPPHPELLILSQRTVWGSGYHQMLWEQCLQPWAPVRHLPVPGCVTPWTRLGTSLSSSAKWACG